jgi:hypothetical protein
MHVMLEADCASCIGRGRGVQDRVNHMDVSLDGEGEIEDGERKDAAGMTEVRRKKGG